MKQVIILLMAAGLAVGGFAQTADDYRAETEQDNAKTPLRRK
jgi:hypothetical protein